MIFNQTLWDYDNNFLLTRGCVNWCIENVGECIPKENTIKIMGVGMFLMMVAYSINEKYLKINDIIELIGFVMVSWGLMSLSKN